MSPRKSTRQNLEQEHDITIKAAKGRPMLSWVGKHPLTRVTAFPAQHIETFDPHSELSHRPATGIWAQWPADVPRGGLLYHGDNKEILAHLIGADFRNSVDMVYIDPPFDSGADYVRKVVLKGPKGTAKLAGEAYSLGEQIQYTDIWTNDNYLQFMYERLLLLKELLAENSNIVMHTGYDKNHLLRCLMDEVFGAENFKSEIVWHFPDNFQGNIKRFTPNHNLLLWYGIGDYPWHKPSRELEKVTSRPTRVWDAATSSLKISRDDDGKPLYKDYTEASFDDVLVFPQRSVVVPDAADYTGYPTAKPPALIALLVDSLCPPGGIVLDAFIGSGTTASVAQTLGRRWIGCDINRGAIQTTAKRLEEVIAGEKQQQLTGHLGAAQRSFTVWRVNDYDLQLQHNEVVNLACEHIGVQRLGGDRYFDGLLGKSLVKVVPFQHPLSPVDLDQLATELESRPDEDRAVTVICLGMEIAATKWLDDWNRLRRSKGSVNKIDVIELRTDEKYGELIRHEPASAKIVFKRSAKAIKVTIEEFLSPTIITRLAQQAGVLKPKIPDWRAMVESVTIDADYNGSVFNICVADAPRRREELVSGSYEVAAKPGTQTVAVKIIDMLGEELIVVRDV